MCHLLHLEFFASLLVVHLFGRRVVQTQNLQDTWKCFICLTPIECGCLLSLWKEMLPDGDVFNKDPSCHLVVITWCESLWGLQWGGQLWLLLVGILKETDLVSRFLFVTGEWVLLRGFQFFINLWSGLLSVRGHWNPNSPNWFSFYTRIYSSVDWLYSNSPIGMEKLSLFLLVNLCNYASLNFYWLEKLKSFDR